MPPQIYYSTPGPMTDPGAMAALLNDLPTDVRDLVRVVQGLLIHVFWAGRYGVTLDEARQSEVQIRPLAAKLELLPWDSWGLVDVKGGEGGDEALSAGDLAALDEMAAQSGDEAADFARIRGLYESSDHWRVPPIITTFTPAGPVSVPL